MIWLFSPLRNKADLAPELKESSGLVLIRAYLFGHHCKGHWLVPQTFTVHWRTPFFRLIIFWTFICRKVMSFFEWKSLKTKQSHNLLVTKKTEISEQPNPPSERTFAFRVWKAGLFWNIKAKSFSIFFLAEVLFEKTQEPVLFSNIVYIHNLFDDSQPCPCCEFIPWFFLVRPGPSSVSPTGLPAVAWGCRLQPLHCHHHISSSLLLVATGPQLLAPCEGEGWPVMTGDDGRDGRLIVAFFFWGVVWWGWMMILGEEVLWLDIWRFLSVVLFILFFIFSACKKKPLIFQSFFLGRFLVCLYFLTTNWKTRHFGSEHQP